MAIRAIAFVLLFIVWKWRSDRPGANDPKDGPRLVPAMFHRRTLIRGRVPTVLVFLTCFVFGIG